MSDLFGEILTSRREIKSRLKQEGDSWNYDNLSLREYNNLFEPLVGAKIDEIADKMHRQKKKLIVVNLLGGTRVLRDLGVEESYAVRLTDGRTPETIAEDKRRNITLISGDILSKGTVNKLPNAIDILLCMPEGAAEFLPTSPDLFYFLGESILKKMSVGGVAMIQLPLTSHQWMAEYVKQVGRSKDLALTYFPPGQKRDEPVFVMEKYSARAHLPIMLYH